MLRQMPRTSNRSGRRSDSDLLAWLAPWLVLPLVPGVPGWYFVGLAVLGIDAVDWLTHLAYPGLARYGGCTPCTTRRRN